MRILCLGLCLLWLTGSSHAATVSLNNEKYTGKVTARMFEHIIITFVTDENRVFQCTAADVEVISATENVLVSVNTFLRQEPSNSAEPTVALTRGQEVTILETPNNSEWVRVKVWGKNEGWMVRELLTKKVVYTPEEKEQSESKNNKH